MESSIHTSAGFEYEKSLGRERALQQDVTTSAHYQIRYRGVPRSEVTRVYEIARQLRFRQPEVHDVRQRIQTELSDDIVSSIIAGAVRLLPADNTPGGITLREERNRLVRTQALDAENRFCAVIRQSGLRFLRESE